MKKKKKPLPDPSYQIPQWALTAAVEYLFEIALRFEIEASVYQQMNTHEGRMLADDRVVQAESLRKASEYFLSL